MRSTLVAAAALAGVLPLAIPLAASPLAPTASAADSDYDLFLNFNASSGGTPDLTSSGSAPVSTEVVTAGGGQVLARARGKGQAARLEPFDPETPTELGVVVVWPDEGKNPFTPRSSPFSFGATFNLDRTNAGTSADNGNNLLQRGLYSDDTQYKIQVDHDRVSCRVSGAAGAVRVRAGRDVRPRVWHRVRCIREGSTVTLVLVELTSDGPVRRTWSRTGATGDLAFSAQPPLSLGGKVESSGKLATASADQFNGRVDNVFFRRLDG